MKRILLFKVCLPLLLLHFLGAVKVNGQVYNIATEDGNTINTCEGTFTDSDAFDDDIYINDEEYIVTFCSDIPGECIMLEFSSFDVPDAQDWLHVWDGSDTTSGTYIGAFNNPFGSTNNNISAVYPDGIQSTSGCLTFFFESDGDFITGIGWEATISCYSACATCTDGIQNGAETGIDCGGICEECPEPINIADEGTVNTCGSVFTDSGGLNGNYSNNESNTITICSDSPNPTLCLQAQFTAFSTEANWDFLYIYDGENTQAPIIGAYSGSDSPGLVVASGNCLTFYFDSDFVVNNYDGWEATLSCGDCAAEPIPSFADCLGALPICNAIENEDTPEEGAGNVTNELPPNACNMPEIEVLWYIFDVGSDGIFNFSLDADPQTNGDYDWAVYDITGLDCDNISSATSVSCNTYGLFSGSGNLATGISTSNGGTGTANGPGDFNGPPFNEDLDVLSGETYALVISNCCGATAGFEIDFSESTADIYDSYPPALVDVVPSCANNQVSLSFSELIDCTTISELDFEVIGANGAIAVSSYVAEWCDFGNEGTAVIDLFLDAVMNENETYSLVINNNEGGIADLCGNAITDENFSFTTSPAMTIETVLTPSDCGGTLATGTAEITVLGGDAPYYVELGGQNAYDLDVYFFDELFDGPQEVVVYDSSGCVATFFIDIPSSNSTMENEIIVSNTSCLGTDGSIEINTNGPSGYGPWNYELTDTTGVLLSSATNTDYFLVENLQQGLYIITVEDLSGLSPCSDLQEITIGPPDNIFLGFSDDTTICYNGEASLIAWVQQGGTGYPFTMYWNDGINDFTTNPGQTIETGVLTSSVLYTVYAEDDIGCASGMVSISIQVLPQLSYDISPSQVVCINSELDLSVTNISGGLGPDYDVEWNLGNNQIVSEASVTVMPTEPTLYCASISDDCETPDVDSCITISPTLEIPISFTIDSETEACPPHLVQFTNTTEASEVGTANWYFGDGEESQATPITNHLYTEPGNYNVALSIITPEGCEFDTIIANAVSIYPVPSASFVMTPQIATLTNNTVEFDNQSQAASSYYWVFDTLNYLGVSAEENPIFIFPDQQPGNYFVSLTAYNEFGCEGSTSQLLRVFEDPSLYIPNSFSPNGDGRNDFFFIQGVGLSDQDYHLIIFDRWGEVVFESNDIQESWNGSVNGGDYFVQSGVFVYKLSYRAQSDTEPSEKQGTITLIR